jgi:hypothetical protein
MNETTKNDSALLDGGPHIPHYYGNVVRVLFIILAVFVAVSIPLSGEMQIAIYVAGPMVIALLLLAGLTNPHSTTIFTLNTLVAGLGLLLSEVLALGAFSASNMPVFVVLEAVTGVCIAAFYYSVKTMRASRMHMIGKDEKKGEFEKQ